MTTFTIIEHKETGEKWLSQPYWLDPSSKWTLFANYEENKEPVFTEFGLGMNEYRSEVKIIGRFEADKVSVSRENHYHNGKQLPEGRDFNHKINLER
jgi:hypothetical protein